MSAKSPDVFDIITGNSVSDANDVEQGNKPAGDQSGSSTGNRIDPPPAGLKRRVKRSPALSALKQMNDNMKDGFVSIKDALIDFGQNLVTSISEKLDEKLSQGAEFDYENEYSSEEEFLREHDEEQSAIENNVFEEISGASDDKGFGPDVHASLAKMMDKLIIHKMEDKEREKKEEIYKQPQNFEYGRVPKTNPAVWDAIRYSTRTGDRKLQEIQQSVIFSSIPICQAMEILFEKKDSPQDLDPIALINILADSINFIGDANVGIVKARKENIKKDLPQAMQGLCKQPENFSPNFIFGEDLNEKIKEVTELNRVKNKFEKDQPRGQYRGAGRGRGTGGRGFKNYRGSPRYRPYNKDQAKNAKRRGNLNAAPKKD